MPNGGISFQPPPPPNPGLWGQPPHTRGFHLPGRSPTASSPSCLTQSGCYTTNLGSSLSPRPPAERGSQHLRQRTPNSRAGACFARQPQVWAFPALGLPPAPHPLTGATEPSLAHVASGLLLPASWPAFLRGAPLQFMFIF